MRVDADGTKQDAILLINNRGDVGHDTNVIMSHHTERNRILLALTLARPFGLDNARTEA